MDDDAERIDALLLPVGEEWHALELSDVREVLPAVSTTPVPAAPGWLDGLANIRGEIVPVVSSARALGSDDAETPTHLVLAEAAAGVLAIAATGTPRACRLGARAGTTERPGGRGRYLADDRLCTLLDLDELTAAP